MKCSTLPLRIRRRFWGFNSFWSFQLRETDSCVIFSLFAIFQDVSRKPFTAPRDFPRAVLSAGGFPQKEQRVPLSSLPATEKALRVRSLAGFTADAFFFHDLEEEEQYGFGGPFWARFNFRYPSPPGVRSSNRGITYPFYGIFLR